MTLVLLVSRQGIHKVCKVHFLGTHRDEIDVPRLPPFARYFVARNDVDVGKVVIL
jgi:hypothetical protein